eukprot:CAMPEP_0174726160 /NCGR_PEP_ID=MMETSP1094-20130205/47137_1 /TAXON_ID=156173 /ORGANISM="Chrysochromulina brevifilum, Strain UTEX LB 985" /LENGTH=37 /DNA_ID= /DNA_START= /DNA_END= /DNA_ORIENTATION=
MMMFIDLACTLLLEEIQAAAYMQHPLRLAPFAGDALE